MGALEWCEASIVLIEIFAPFQFVPVRVKTRVFKFYYFHIIYRTDRYNWI